jgi:hypothetical protein
MTPFTPHEHEIIDGIIKDLHDGDRLTQGRTCGRCALCCKLLNVDDLETDPPTRKPPWVWCKHTAGENPRNCAIYSKRPGPCRKYACAWLNGFFSDELQPRACGAVVHAENVDRLGGPVWHVYEARPGQARHHRWVKLLVAALVADGRYPVAIVHGPEAPGQLIEGQPSEKLTRVSLYVDRVWISGHFHDTQRRGHDTEDWSQ